MQLNRVVINKFFTCHIVFYIFNDFKLLFLPIVFINYLIKFFFGSVFGPKSNVIHRLERVFSRLMFTKKNNLPDSNVLWKTMEKNNGRRCFKKVCKLEFDQIDQAVVQ